MIRRLQRAQVAVLAIGLGFTGSGLALAAEPPPIVFAPPLEFSTGIDWPFGMVSSDFNGDGRADLAVLLDQSLGVAILLGRGDGTFDSAPPALPTQFGGSLAAADFNRDGHQDIILGRDNPHTAYFAFGAGDGTFVDGPSYATGVDPSYPLAGDFNGDGWPDLFIGSWLSGMAVFLNLRNGLMGARVDLRPDDNPALFGNDAAYDIADLDADGKEDIVSAVYEQPDFECTGTGFTFWKSLGTGAFTTTHVSGPNCPYAITTADWDRDGRRDVLVLGFIGMGISRHLGGGAFAPAPLTFIDLEAYRLMDADYNLDGLLDLALPLNTEFLPRAGRSDGTLTSETPVALPGRYLAVARDDFDNDGLADLAVAVHEEEGVGQVNAVEVFLNRSVNAPPGIGEAASGATPLQVTGYDAASGNLSITYGPACGATDHSVVYGSLEAPDRGAYLGRNCGLGTSGSASFNPGTGSFFFLLVGDNGTIEGSFGASSFGAERPESFALAACDRPQVLTAACP